MTDADRAAEADWESLEVTEAAGAAGWELADADPPADASAETPADDWPESARLHRCPIGGVAADGFIVTVLYLNTRHIYHGRIDRR